MSPRPSRIRAGSDSEGLIRDLGMCRGICDKLLFFIIFCQRWAEMQLEE